jgi:hypothetical protein
MGTRTRDAEPVEFNPEMLRWAREWRARTLEEAGKRIGKPATAVGRWEDGDGAPTVLQARALAEFYGRDPSSSSSGTSRP